MDKIIVKRGDVFYADLSLIVGSQQGGMRPVVIIQNDIGNKYAPTVNVLPIVSMKSKLKIPIHVEISAQELNLNGNYVIITEQITTLDKRRLKEKIGNLNNDVMEKVEKALAIQLHVFCNSIHKFDKEKDVEEYYRYIELEPIAFMEEDLDHEFKEIKGRNPVNHINSNVGEYICSFLNSNGGCIFYGITNDGIVQGVNVNRQQKDEIRKSINNAINSIEPKISADIISIEFKNIYSKDKQKINDNYIIEVHVDRPLDKKDIYVYKNEIHIRLNGVKNKLQGNAIVDYIRRKTIKDYSLDIKV